MHDFASLAAFPVEWNRAHGPGLAAGHPGSSPTNLGRVVCAHHNSRIDMSPAFPRTAHHTLRHKQALPAATTALQAWWARVRTAIPYLDTPDLFLHFPLNPWCQSLLVTIQSPKGTQIMAAAGRTSPTLGPLAEVLAALSTLHTPRPIGLQDTHMPGATPEEAWIATAMATDWWSRFLGQPLPSAHAPKGACAVRACAGLVAARAAALDTVIASPTP